jgi:hypothetical protein
VGVPWGIPHSLTNLPLPIPLPLSPGTAFINQPLYPALAILYPVPAIAVRTSNGSLMAAQIAAVSRLTSRTAVALKFKIISQINTFPPVAKCEFQSYHVRCSFVARSLLVRCSFPSYTCSWFPPLLSYRTPYRTPYYTAIKTELSTLL